MADRRQPAHFFDRVPADDHAAAPVGRAFMALDPVTGHYVFWDSVPPTDQVFWTVDGDGVAFLDTTSASSHDLLRYGATVQF